MNSPKNSTSQINSALSALEEWITSIHSQEGYHGPAIGFKGHSIGFCGAGFDWRYEGLIDGWIALHQQTHRDEYLDRIEQAIKELASAQLRNGSFRNSYFEENPFEGGMPYEPATVAALCRARTLLASTQRSTTTVDRIIERFLERRCIRELWCKTEQTFNNWMQSDFDNWMAAAVAPIAEILLFYANETQNEAYTTHYAAGAIQSILALQQANNLIAVSQYKKKLIIPLLTARCLPALVQFGEQTNDTSYTKRAEAIFQALEETASDLGYPTFCSPDHPASYTPSFTGATAGILNACARAGFHSSRLHPLMDQILKRQNKAGGFETAVGFGYHKTADQQDWRDVIPCIGWNDKIYHLLARHSDGGLSRAETSAVVKHVFIRKQTGIYTEDAKHIQIEDHKGRLVYEWIKKKIWAEIAEL
jgi:hypothetical protein